MTPEAGNTVAVVVAGSGGNASPRPNSTLPRPNSTTATRISTTRYSRTKVTCRYCPKGLTTGPPDQAGFERGWRLNVRRARRLRRGARFATWTMARSVAFIVAIGDGVNAA